MKRRSEISAHTSTTGTSTRTTAPTIRQRRHRQHHSLRPVGQPAILPGRSVTDQRQQTGPGHRNGLRHELDDRRQRLRTVRRKRSAADILRALQERRFAHAALPARPVRHGVRRTRFLLLHGLPAPRSFAQTFLQCDLRPDRAARRPRRALHARPVHLHDLGQRQQPAASADAKTRRDLLPGTVARSTELERRRPTAMSTPRRKTSPSRSRPR